MYIFPCKRIRYIKPNAINTHIDCANNSKCSVRYILTHALLVFSVDELHGPEASVANPCNSWFSSSLEDESDHMELCVAMSRLIYHWLL